MAFDRKQYFRETGSGFLTVPIALQFADQLHPACRLRAGLNDALQSRFVRFNRGSGDRVDDWIDFKTFLHRVERRVHQAHFRPQRRHDEFLAPSRFHGGDEIGVFPGIDRGAVDRRDAGKHVGDLMDRRLVDCQ